MNSKNNNHSANFPKNLESISNYTNEDKKFLAEQRKKNDLIAKRGGYTLVQLDCIADYLKENGLL